MVSYYLFLFTSKFETSTRGTNSMPFLVFRRDHLRSTSGIICRSGSFAVQFEVHLRLGIIYCAIQNHSFLLPQFFCPPYMIAIASSVCQTFASSLIDVFSFAVFAFSNCSMFLIWSVFTYNLIELHLIQKMLGSQNNNADQLSSQFVTSVQVIPAKIASVDCICAIGLSIKR